MADGKGEEAAPPPGRRPSVGGRRRGFTRIAVLV